MDFLSCDSVFTQARLPRRPLCTDLLSDGCWHEPVALAMKRKYIQVNPPRTTLWMTFDVDQPAGGLAWESANLPPPAWSCTTRKNGYGHIVYGLAMPVRGRDLSNKAVRYLEAVKEGYRSRLQADPCYAGLLTKNPLHPDWLVEKGLQKLWTLDELAEYVELPSSNFMLLRKQQELGMRGRNMDTFDRLRFWAYRSVDGYRVKGKQDWTCAVDQMLDHLNDLNFPPLDQTELKHIARSVCNWVWTKYSGTNGSLNKLASQLGKLGGRPRTTTLKGKPWVEQGVSRATWYRLPKNLQQVSNKSPANETKASDSLPLCARQGTKREGCPAPN